VRRRLSGLLVIVSVALATETRAATPSYTQKRFIARGSDALRTPPSTRNGSDSVRQPYPPRFYGDESRGIQGCGWLMRRAIDTNNRNWLQRYRACAR
jgi:hypothetical protein